MKKVFTSVALLLSIGLARPVQAHKEWVHQYLVSQAYLYLEQQIGSVPELRSAIAPGNGIIGAGNNGYPFNSNNPISNGAWREDLEDVVYGYTGGISEGVDGGFTPSITHFWKADNGEGDLTSIGPIGHYENAWMKAKALMFCQSPSGPKTIKVPWISYIFSSGSIATTYGITYASLAELYKGNFFIEYSERGGNRTYHNHQQINNQNFEDGFPKKVALDLLGRVAHLLGDMSVPAHTHKHLHPCPVGRPDKFENHLGNSFYRNNALWNCESYPGDDDLPAYRWTAASALNQGSLINDIYCLNSGEDKLKYLFYTQNQLGDFFPSGVEPEDKLLTLYAANMDRQGGDAALPYGSNYHINNVYNQFGNTPPPIIDVNQIGDVTFNFGIRATATLLQWFAFEAGIIDNLRNEKIANNSGINHLCPNSSASGISVPNVPINSVTWSINPAFAATGQVVGNEFVITGTSDNTSTYFTVEASFSRIDGCYPTSNTLKRKFYKGPIQPSANGGLVPTESNINFIVNPGQTFPIEATTEASGLQNNTYSWSMEINGTTTPLYGGTSYGMYVTAPSTFSTLFSIQASVQDRCGNILNYRRAFQTAEPPVGCDGCSVSQATSTNPTALSTTVNTPSKPLEIQIFPNPSNSGFDIKLPALSAAESKLVFTLTDMLGRTVQEGQLTKESTHVSTEAISAGQYILKIVSKSKVEQRVVQVQH